MTLDPSLLPTIALVTPNYNYAHFIEATIRSVLDQNYPKLEYIVLDDGSTDDSVEVIRRYSNRITGWERNPNRGQYPTLTAGLNRTAAEVMGWLNSDDMHCPWTLHAVGSIFATFPDVRWVSSLAPLTWDYSGLCVGAGACRGFSRAAFLDGCNLPGETFNPTGYIQQESTFWRRSLWEMAGGYISNDFGAAGDFDLWARFYEHTELIGVSAPLAGFRQQYRQQTAQVAKYNANCRRSLVDARKRAGWTGRPPGRALAVNTRGYRLPVAGGWLAKAAGYSACRIIRTDVAGPNPGWELKTFRFL